MEFNARDFVFAHGHSPRGTGTWAFSIRRDPVLLLSSEPKVFYFSGLFRDAKKAARQHFKGAAVVYVLS